MIRRSRKNDQKHIHALIRTELIPFSQKTFPDVKYNKREINKRLERGYTYVYARTPNAPPQGFIHSVILDNTHIVDMLAVNKNARKRGIGSKLMNRSLSLALKNKCSKSHLYVDAVNYKAQQFYYKQGYQIEKYEPLVNCYLLSKKIG
ncbi:GNAT family N-acetyltransferase [Paenibacillus sp. FSL W8-0186]|uniref:GNAT family N-acetyltransferase n=1 Tax=Paenibacillus woosongensis TaxID=307580 RepID=A0A7X2Z3P2_9BACL|nr:GNAT family N-acetyltransferase [Paenibacillus woosongensis]MUG46418.1 GNAT family N-acetyltransferase [Paenibacillus woosongensis]